MKLIESLNWRYATKKFSNQKVDAEKINQIIDATNLSASSTGLQPYRLVVVSDPELQAKLGEGSFNPQIAEASHLLVFAAFSRLTKQDIEAYMNEVATQRNLPADSLNDFQSKLEGFLLPRSDSDNFQWAARQAYIGLGTALAAAAELQVDSTPMEGFASEQFDRLLGLEARGLKSVVVLALGYRDAEKDMFANFKKVRLPRERFALTAA